MVDKHGLGHLQWDGDWHLVQGECAPVGFSKLLGNAAILEQL